MSYQPIRYRWQWQLKSLPHQLWSLIVSVSDPRELDGEGGRFSRIAHNLLFKAPEKGRQTTYDWIKNAYLSNKTVYPKGAVKGVTYELTMTRNAKGTLVKYDVEITPNSPMSKFVAPLYLGKEVHRRLDSLYRRMDKLVQNSKNGSVAALSPQLSDSKVAFLNKMAQQLVAEGSNETGTQALMQVICYDPDPVLAVMRSHSFADLWTAPRKRVLELFLAATRHRILQTRWQITCPNCQRWHTFLPSLSNVTPQMHCRACKSDFEVNLSTNIELTFRVHPRIRKLTNAANDGPAASPRVLAQQHVKANKLENFPLALPSGRYSIQTLESTPEQWTTLDIEDNYHGEITVEITNEAIEVKKHPEQGDGLIRVANKTNSDQCLFVENSAWQKQRLTATEANTCHYYRTHFASDVQPAEHPLPVASLSVLVSDLVGSTALSAQRGDNAGYKVVRELYDFQEAIITHHDGTIVKAMDDAIIAAFVDPADALKAALAINRDTQTFNALRPINERISIKLGLHCGPCIAVNLNSQLDFFGSTIGIARSVCHTGTKGDLIVSKNIKQHPGIEEMLKVSSISISELSEEFSGFQDKIEMFRLKETPQEKNTEQTTS